MTRSIVVGVHGGTGRQLAVDFAVEEAVRRRLPLHVVHAYSVPVFAEVPPVLYPDSLAGLPDAARRVALTALDGAKARVPGGATVTAHLEVHESDPVAALLRAAEGAALLVVGSHGANALARGLLGSVSAACLHRCSAPVAVVPEHAEAYFETWRRSRVVVAIDGSPPAQSALEWAVAQATEWGCALIPVVVSARAEAAAHDLAATVWRQVTEAGGADLDVQPRYLVGRADEQLLGALEPHDLLVMGSRGHGALPGLLLGSTSLSVTQQARCPVVVVRAGEARRETRLRSSGATTA